MVLIDMWWLVLALFLVCVVEVRIMFPDFAGIMQ
jgi:hypothetical protein